jgi:tetratricopeptide (TPR) repeat protein
MPWVDASSDGEAEFDLSGSDEELRSEMRRQAAVARSLIGAKDEASLFRRARASGQVGLLLETLGERERAMVMYSAAATLLAPFPLRRGWIVMFKCMLGDALMELERFEEALVVFQRVIDEVGIGGVPAGWPLDGEQLLVSAVHSWLAAMQRLGRVEQAAAAGVAVIESYGYGEDATDRRRQAVVLEAYLAVALDARRRGDLERALDYLDRAAAPTTQAVSREAAVAKGNALLERASLLDELAVPERADEALHELIARFETVEYEPLQLLVSEAKQLLTSSATRSRFAGRGGSPPSPVPGGSREESEIRDRPSLTQSLALGTNLTPKDQRRVEKISACEKVIAETEGASDDASMQRRGKALFDLAAALSLLRRYAKAIEYYRRASPILWRFDSLRFQAVRCEANMAFALMQCGRDQEALDTITTLVGTVGLKPPSPDETKRYVSIAMNWLVPLQKQGRLQEAAHAAAALIDAFDPGSSPLEFWALARAFRLHGDAARETGDNDDAFSDYEKAIERARSGLALQLNEELAGEVTADVAHAIAGRGAILAEQGRIRDAKDVCEALIAEFGSDTSPLVRIALDAAEALLDVLASRIDP